MNEMAENRKENTEIHKWVPGIIKMAPCCAKYIEDIFIWEDM